MPDIVLTTLNARYWHSSFGLRYLMANMGPLRARCCLREFGISERSVDIIDRLLADEPQIIGFGVYIWNVDEITQIVADLKQLRPDITIVLGGPEVSYETESQQITEFADHVITGEGDLAFRQLCEQLLDRNTGQLSVLPQKIIHAEVPDLADISMPYDLYTDEDIAHRVIYVEVSRGCPFTCEFCLSALDIPVRLFDVNDFLCQMQTLLDKGARQFKFVDRTFNLNMRVSRAILQFFLERCCPGLFLHFEMIPDRLPDSLRELIAQFPPGVLQFEIGVQTFNDDVGDLISRRQDNDQLEQNFRFLAQQTGVHIHADLIVGLPGESVESFGRGFDRLVSLNPQEIQVGILKRLKGTPITRHDEAWNMVYSRHPPFEVLSNRLIDFVTMHRLRRFARYWDLVANSGNFRRTIPLLWADGRSAFDQFLQFSDWLYEREQRTHGIPLVRLAERLFDFLVESQQPEPVALSIWEDYTSQGRRDRPAFLRKFNLPAAQELPSQSADLPTRQARHIASP